MSCPCTTIPSCAADECCPPDDYAYQATKLEVWMIADFGVNTTSPGNTHGGEDPNAEAVANLVKGYKPDALLMVGDCRYNNDYVQTVGTLYGGLKAANKILPCPGNHDWDYGALANYQAYFGVNRYYSRRFGPVEFFMLDSGWNSAYELSEPDGNTQGTLVQPSPTCCGSSQTTTGGSTQWQWFETAVAASDARWKIACLHHPPYASGNGHWGASPLVSKWGSHATLQWESFARHGVNAVLSGHEHSYERLERDGVTYIVNGLGGKSIYGFGSPVITGSKLTYNSDYGAVRLVITPDRIFGSFLSVSNTLVDEWVIE